MKYEDEDAMYVVEPISPEERNPSNDQGD